jgi:hypothetical protein
VSARSWPLIRKYSRTGELLGESSFSLPPRLVKDQDRANYTLNFIERNPNASYVLPLVAFSATVGRDGHCYVFLNYAGLVRVSPDGKVVKQGALEVTRFTKRLFVSMRADPLADRLLLLDYNAGNIQAISLAANPSLQ